MTTIVWHDAEEDPPKADGLVWAKVTGQKESKLARYHCEERQFEFMTEFAYNCVVYWTPCVPPEFYD